MEPDLREPTVWSVSKSIVGRLAPKYGEREAQAMMKIIFENLKGWSTVDLAIKANEPMSAFMQGKVDGVVQRLLDDEPIQYIFGVADFYGMKFHVNSATLIPRPETAELVDWIVNENQRKDLRVLDLGTGTGCIAVALARNLPFPDVTAVDVSGAALDVARKNAAGLSAKITFVEADMLQLADSGRRGKLSPQLSGQFDIIVSNPPYIAEKEKGAMAANVLEHEPASALFVPDSNPLLFYRAVVDFAGEALAEGGAIYFEINPDYVRELSDLCAASGFGDVTVRRDSFGKERFMRVAR